MELQLELTLSTSRLNQEYCDKKKKRSFGEAFSGVEEKVDAPPTLQLFTRHESEKKQQQQQINGELYDQKERLEFSDRNAHEVKDDSVVGWPPVKSWRKQLCHHNRRRYATNYVNVENGGSGGGGGRGTKSNSVYVKVKMEGVGIARKVDLTIHHSYHTLAAKLLALFGKCEGNMEEYKLIYQNKGGDWLRARDVPWETFIKSVQRLKLEKNGY